LRDARTPEDQKYLTLSTPTKIRDEYEKLGKAKVREIEKSYPAKLSIQSMKDWMKAKIDTGDPQECKPCLLGPIVNWYFSLLKENSVDEQYNKLEKAVDNLDEDDPQQLLKLCETLDEIKKIVVKSIRKQLEEFDQSVQEFNPEDIEALQEEEENEEETPENNGGDETTEEENTSKDTISS
jgi:hypothetical protein